MIENIPRDSVYTILCDHLKWMGMGMQTARRLRGLIRTSVAAPTAGFGVALAIAWLLLALPLAVAQTKPSDPHCPNPTCEGKREFTVYPRIILQKASCGGFENVVSAPTGQGRWECPATLAGGEVCKYHFQNGLWALQVEKEPEEKPGQNLGQRLGQGQGQGAKKSACPKAPPDICGPGELAIPKDQIDELHRDVYHILRLRPNGELAKDACNCKVLAESEWCSLGSCVEKPDTYGITGVSEVRARLDMKTTKCVVAISYDVSFECTGTCAP